MATRDAVYLPGTPCWTDLSTSDPDVAIEFYVRVFGWDVEVAEMGHYVIASRDGRAVAGINRIVVDHPPQWTTYLATDDVDATVTTMTAAGGATVLGPIDVPGAGRLALMTDAVGARVGLWQGGALAGAGIVDEPAAMIWNELLTRDYDAALACYGAVFDVAFTEIGDGVDFRFSTISAGGDVVGGIGAGDRSPVWRMYFGSADPDATIERACELGASLVDEPHDTPFGRWGSVTDPQGAAFSVITPPSAT